MKKTIALWMLLAPAICWAQPPADCKPSSLNVPGAPYPCVFPDHRAMFRLSAPDAQKVRVRVGTGFDMAKEETAYGMRRLRHWHKASTTTW
jgi:hypothetical protein